MAEETGFAFSMDSFRLDGKVALVTGGSYGIGFAIATALAQAGAKIAFNDRDQQKLEAGLASYAEAGVATLPTSPTRPRLPSSSPTSSATLAASTSWSTTPASSSASPCSR